MLSGIRLAAVLVADRLGWLNIVDRNVVNLYVQEQLQNRKALRPASGSVPWNANDLELSSPWEFLAKNGMAEAEVWTESEGFWRIHEVEFDLIFARLEKARDVLGGEALQYDLKSDLIESVSRHLAILAQLDVTTLLPDEARTLERRYRAYLVEDVLERLEGVAGRMVPQKVRHEIVPSVSFWELDVDAMGANLTEPLRRPFGKEREQGQKTKSKRGPTRSEE